MTRINPDLCWLNLVRMRQCDCGLKGCMAYFQVTYLWDQGRRGTTFWMGMS